MRSQTCHLCCHTHLDTSVSRRWVSEEVGDGEGTVSEASSLLSYTLRYVSLMEVGTVCQIGFREPMYAQCRLHYRKKIKLIKDTALWKLPYTKGFRLRVFLRVKAGVKYFAVRIMCNAVTISRYKRKRKVWVFQNRLKGFP